MVLKFSKTVKKESKETKDFGFSFNKKDLIGAFKESISKSSKEGFNPAWNLVLLFTLFLCIFGFLIFHISNLQVLRGEEMLERSKYNQLRIKEDNALRGAIMDKNGNLLAKNISSMNVYLSVERYLDKKGYVDTESLGKACDTLGGIIGDLWKDENPGEESKYTSLPEKIYSIYEANTYFTEILVAKNINDDMAIKIKASANELPGVYVDSGSKREYPYGEVFSHILGYTGTVTAEDLKKLKYADSTDTVGRIGLEKEYDEELIGEDGEIAWEVDSMGRTVEKEGYTLRESVAGKNLYLSIDIDTQQKLYELMEKAVVDYKAIGGAAIIEDVNTGELLALVSNPGYDNNLFVGGISQGQYNELLNDPRNPLLNRSIAAQMPPGSTFKTIVAAGGLEAGVLTRNTIYVSRSGYTFTGGASFQEYGNNSYGPLNLIDAISVSSNIYFCEMIRRWNMDALVPYIEKFGIGKYTGIDIPGEAPGRLPSPANKIELAKTSPWLEPVWYPEGDSCNSVIGQGITLVTPIQMANWTAAIANGGTLHTPHLAKSFENEKKVKEDIKFTPLGEKILSEKSLDTVLEGMWNAVNGPRATIRGLAGIPGLTVAAKTGTAEFGKLNKKGEYEHTHAWVTTIFPYDNPKYVLTMFLEDGGQSYNTAKVAKEMIVWMKENGKL
ncbi:MAG: penicillin-binding protein 2 [Candidatus Dojkabacteria bacterium]|jgi:penicillin-binding protein 2